MNKKDLKSLIPILEKDGSKEALRLKKKIEKESKPISVASRKAKGRGLQQLLAEKISERTGIPWGYNNEEIQPRLMGGSGTDVLLIGRAKDVFPFSPECKATETFSIKATIEQAVANQEEGTDWLVVHKRKGMNPVAIVDLDVFMNIFFK